MKGMIILVLLIVIIGFYIAPELTKKSINTVGKASLNAGKAAFDEVKDSEEIKELKENIKDKISDKINKTLHNDS